MCITGRLEHFLEPSDEEVLPESDEESLSDEEFEDAHTGLTPSKPRFNGFKIGRPLQESDSDASAKPEEDGDDVGWGTSRKDYYNADRIETEADALEEEAEARRLQQKQLQGMTEADFGFDETAWLEAGHDNEKRGPDEDGITREILPRLEITDAMGFEERAQIFKAHYPEFEPLAREFLDLQSVHDSLTIAAEEALTAVSSERNKSMAFIESPTPVAALKQRALSAYLATLSMYFALLSSGSSTSNGTHTAMPAEKLREHRVMETLMQCRDLWEKVKDIPLPDPPLESADKENMAEYEKLGLVAEEQPKTNVHKSKHQSKRVRKAERAIIASQAEADARRQERLRKTEESFADLSTLTSKAADKLFRAEPERIAGEEVDNDSDFGDATTLTPQEASEKAKRKKSLRFYTSQIAQKSNKRDNAGRDAGGDADLPYRERLKDRQARLNAEAERRGQKPRSKAVGATLGEGSAEEEDDPMLTNKQRGNASDSEDYYDLVSRKAADKKASKAVVAELHRNPHAALQNIDVNDNSLDPGVKRGITYAIEKNKGLHQHRKKEVRNPRVKKRKKFEEKKKKLGSTRAVYKSDREGKGGYGGEKTGIKRGLVRSVKL